MGGAVAVEDGVGRAERVGAPVRVVDAVVRGDEDPVEELLSEGEDCGEGEWLGAGEGEGAVEGGGEALAGAEGVGGLLGVCETEGVVVGLLVGVGVPLAERVVVGVTEVVVEGVDGGEGVRL